MKKSRFFQPADLIGDVLGDFLKKSSSRFNRDFFEKIASRSVIIVRASDSGFICDFLVFVCHFSLDRVVYESQGEKKKEPRREGGDLDAQDWTKLRIFCNPSEEKSNWDKVFPTKRFSRYGHQI